MRPLNAQPNDEFSAAERAFFSGGEPVESDARAARSWNEEPLYPERVAWLQDLTRSGDGDVVDDRKRNTAKALRNVVVVSKRRLPPRLVATNGLPEPVQSSNGLLAVAAICSMAAVFLVGLRSSQHIETRVSAAQAVGQSGRSPAAAQENQPGQSAGPELKAIPALPPLPTITPTETLLSEAAATVDSSSAVSSQPVSSAALPGRAAPAARQTIQGPAAAHETVTSRVKPPARPFAAKLAKPEVSRKPPPPARSASWLDTPIAPPED